MHVYIYDSFLNQKKFKRLLANLETRLTDLGLNGKTYRLGLLKNPKEMVDQEIKKGAKTIVAVGNDKTVNQIINTIAESNLAFGVIPIGEEDNQIAKSLGVSLTNACEILSARRISKIDLALANQYYFLANASIVSQETSLEINKNYTIEISGRGEIKIVNLFTAEKSGEREFNSHPQDGQLELLIKTKRVKNFLTQQTDQSVFTIKKISIKNKKFLLLLDGVIKIATPAEVRVSKQKLRVIVGRERNF